VHSVANDYDAIEGQTGLGAVPSNELIDGVLLHATRSWRAEAVEHRQFAMIQIRQAKHSATVIRLNSLFAHDDGLPCRRIGTTAQIVWAMQALAAIVLVLPGAPEPSQHHHTRMIRPSFCLFDIERNLVRRFNHGDYGV
jgi:hypothetical protein